MEILFDNGTCDVAALATLEEVYALREPWRELARRALEPNPFYEPELLLPALEYLGPFDDLVVLAIHARRRNGRRLAGLVPLARVPAGPLGRFRMFGHPHCYLRTPLMHRDHADGCVDVLLDWLDTLPGGFGFLELGHVRGDGPFLALVLERLAKRRQPASLLPGYTRALFLPKRSPEEYIQKSIGKRRRQELERRRRRLEEAGSVTVDYCGPGDDAEPWIRAFLDLEVRGWKGREGTALACSEANRNFFEAAASAAHERGQLLMSGLRIDDRLIAASCNFEAATGGLYAFKIAFDESYQRFSPGTLLEIEHIFRFHETRATVDSCAHPETSVLNSLWSDRRTLATVVCAASSVWRRMLVSTLPTARSTVRVARRLWSKVRSA
jgi:CelD/BcsL family acetyltransferase involved in cellulose biosynthesis